MNRSAWLLVWLTLGSAAGCLHTPGRVDDRARQLPAEAPAVPPPAATVTADQITETNALEKVRALRGEIEQAAHRPAPAAEMPGREE